jgi:hypothetical protein
MGLRVATLLMILTGILIGIAEVYASRKQEDAYETEHLRN